MEKMGEVGSTAFDINVGLETRSNGQTHQTVVDYAGDFRTDGYSSGQATVASAGQTIEADVISQASPFMVTTHVREAPSEEWDVVHGYSPYYIALDELFGSKSNDLTGLAITGVEEVDGVETRVISGKLRGFEIAGSHGDFDIVYWIGLEDGLLHRVFASGILDLDDDAVLVGGIEAETAVVRLTAELSNHGKRVDAVTPSLGLRRFQHEALRLDDGRVLVGGGFTGIANNNVVVPIPSESIQIYDPETDLWSFLDIESGPGILYSAVKLADGRVLFIGVRDDENQVAAAASVFDASTNTLVKLPAPPSLRGFPETFLLDDGRVLVVGGFDVAGSASWYSPKYVSAVELFDPEGGQWQPAAPMHQVFENRPLFISLNDGQVMALGMVDDGSPDGTAHAEMYDPASNTWTVISSIEPFYAPTNAVNLSDGRLLVFGKLSGYSSMSSQNGEVTHVELPDGRQFNSSEFAAQYPAAKVFDPATDAWNPAGETIYARSQHTLTLLPDGRVLAAGGEDSWSKDFLPRSTSEIFDPLTNSWSPGPDLSELRSGHSATPLSDGKVLLVGGIGMVLENEEIFPLATSEIVDPTKAGREPPSVPTNAGTATESEDVNPTDIQSLACAAPSTETSLQSLSVKEVLDLTSEAMRDLESGHADLSIRLSGVSDADVVTLGMDARGDFQLPDRFQISMDFYDANLHRERVEIVALGDMTYETTTEAGGWSMSPEPFTPVREFIALGAFDKDLVAEVVEGFQSVGAEVLDGEEVFCLSGQASGKVLSDLLDEPGEGVGETHFWVGAEDFTVRRMAIVADLAVEEGTATANLRLNVRLSNLGKTVNIRTPEVDSGDTSPIDQGAVSTETLETGWVKADIVQKGFSMSIPPAWDLDTSQVAINLRTTAWLSGRDTSVTGPHGVHAQLTLEADELFSVYDSLDEYLDIYKANVAFLAEIAEDDIDVQHVNLPAGDAVQMRFSNTSPSLGIKLSHIKYLLVHEGVALIVTFSAPTESMEDMSPVFSQIAATMETY